MTDTKVLVEIGRNLQFLVRRDSKYRNCWQGRTAALTDRRLIFAIAPFSGPFETCISLTRFCVIIVSFSSGRDRSSSHTSACCRIASNHVYLPT